MAYNEKEHILSCQDGNTEAFGLIYDHHIRTIYNFIYYKVLDKDSAEDLTSQTFLKALRNVGSVDPDRPIISWLYKIAHNTVVDHYRSRKNTENIDDHWDLGDEKVDIAAELDVSVDMDRIGKYLKQLSSLEREIIFMRVWEELPYQAIAEVLGKTEGNCKMIYSRTIKKLKSMIN